MGTFYEVIHSIPITWPDILIRLSRASLLRIGSRSAYFIPVHLLNLLRSSFQLLLASIQRIRLHSLNPTKAECTKVDSCTITIVA